MGLRKRLRETDIDQPTQGETEKERDWYRERGKKTTIGEKEIYTPRERQEVGEVRQRGLWEKEVKRQRIRHTQRHIKIHTYAPRHGGGPPNTE